MSAPDPIAALVAVLKADSAVSALTGGRVFGGELPDGENVHMPRACVVVRYAGGPSALGGGYQQYGDVRVDARSYGSTPNEAGQLYGAVRDALKQMRRQVKAGTRLHWCRAAGGPLSLRDASTSWPYCASAWQVLAGEVAVT